MKIKIKDKELELVSPLSSRTNIMYEDIMDESVDFAKFDKKKPTSTIAKLLYANILATLEANRLPLDLDYRYEFKDCIDNENGGQQFFLDYLNWIAQLLNVQSILTEETEVDTKEYQVDDKTKKNVEVS